MDLKSSSGHVALQNLTIYYMLKNIRKQYKNNKLKILASKWNDLFEFPDGSCSVSDIQDYIINTNTINTSLISKNTRLKN